LVENVHVAELAVRDFDEGGDIAAQIQQCVHLHRRFGLSKLDPMETMTGIGR
jgi:hypothetical protein